VSNVSDIPEQSGRVALVTGANSGLGFEVARTLALHGAAVVLGCRDREKGQEAAARISAAGARDPRVVELDLASLTSVRRAAAEIRSHHPRLDLLVNNGGVMHVVPYQRSADGFELTFATNHLGHFALTGLLLDRVLAADAARVVTVSSLAHKRGAAPVEDTPSAAEYKPGKAYDQSKLANLLFTYELQRRFRAAGAAAIAVAAHPGIVDTPLWRTSSSVERALVGRRLRIFTFWLAQNAQAGAQPLLRAAVDDEASGGEYYGPGGWLEFTGQPARVGSSPASHDADAQRRLWTLSERLSSVHYPKLDAAATPEHSDRAAP
jgi:NAD(P)-dependent dehydrogenase (short-subunit alcohol dehydrogenase family)